MKHSIFCMLCLLGNFAFTITTKASTREIINGIKNLRNCLEKNKISDNFIIDQKKDLTSMSNLKNCDQEINTLLSKTQKYPKKHQINSGITFKRNEKRAINILYVWYLQQRPDNNYSVKTKYISNRTKYIDLQDQKTCWYSTDYIKEQTVFKISQEKESTKDTSKKGFRRTKKLNLFNFGRYKYSTVGIHITEDELAQQEAHPQNRSDFCYVLLSFFLGHGSLRDGSWDKIPTICSFFFTYDLYQETIKKYFISLLENAIIERK